MACFIVPMVEAIAATALRKSHVAKPASFLGRHLHSLELMLWGGTLMLIVDHVLSGELTWQFPFFTALGQVGGAHIMLYEMLSVGLPMAIVLTLAWAVGALLKDRRQVARAKS